MALAGDGPERRRLEALARRLGAADCVRFLGFRHDVRRLLKVADVLLFRRAWKARR